MYSSTEYRNLDILGLRICSLGCGKSMFINCLTNFFTPRTTLLTDCNFGKIANTPIEQLKTLQVSKVSSKEVLTKFSKTMEDFLTTFCDLVTDEIMLPEANTKFLLRQDGKIKSSDLDLSDPFYASSFKSVFLMISSAQTPCPIRKLVDSLKKITINEMITLSFLQENIDIDTQTKVATLKPSALSKIDPSKLDLNFLLMDEPSLNLTLNESWEMKFKKEALNPLAIIETETALPTEIKKTLLHSSFFELLPTLIDIISNTCEWRGVITPFLRVILLHLQSITSEQLISSRQSVLKAYAIIDEVILKLEKEESASSDANFELFKNELDKYRKVHLNQDPSTRKISNASMDMESLNTDNAADKKTRKDEYIKNKAKKVAKVVLGQTKKRAMMFMEQSKIEMKEIVDKIGGDKLGETCAVTMNQLSSNECKYLFCQVGFSSLRRTAERQTMLHSRLALEVSPSIEGFQSSSLSIADRDSQIDNLIIQGKSLYNYLGSLVFTTCSHLMSIEATLPNSADRQTYFVHEKACSLCKKAVNIFVPEVPQHFMQPTLAFIKQNTVQRTSPFTLPNLFKILNDKDTMQEFRMENESRLVSANNQDSSNTEVKTVLKLASVFIDESFGRSCQNLNNTSFAPLQKFLDSGNQYLILARTFTELLEEIEIVGLASAVRTYGKLYSQIWQMLCVKSQIHTPSVQLAAKRSASFLTAIDRLQLIFGELFEATGDTPSTVQPISSLLAHLLPYLVPSLLI